MKINRIINPTELNIIEIKNKILTEENEIIIQFDEDVYSDEILSEINNLASSLNKNLVVRFYGHKKGFDCKVLLKIDKVKNLSIDCLEKVRNSQALSKLKYLKVLRFGVETFKETEILKFDNLKKIEELNLYNNYKLNLEYLKEYSNLKTLMLSGKFANINSVSSLNSLETLFLNSINKNIDFKFVNKLENLKKLHIGFGSRENINEITNQNIEDLTILRVRGLNTLSNVSHFRKLKKLEIRDQAQVLEIIFDVEMKDLKMLSINNCKKIQKIEGFDKLNNLKIIGLLRLPKIKFDYFISQKLPKTLEHINFYTETKQDKEIKEKIRELGYKTS